MSNGSPGRPRSTATRAAILEAAFTILVDRGYSAMSIEAVATAAGAGKATLYRWWPTRADLAVESFFEATQASLAMPDTGSAREDFRLQITQLAVLLAGQTGRALAGMLGGARIDPALARALNERWLAPRRLWGMQRMRRAVADGEVWPDVDVEVALALLYSPVYTPLLFGQDVPPVSMITAILDLALGSIFRDGVPDVTRRPEPVR